MSVGQKRVNPVIRLLMCIPMSNLGPRSAWPGQPKFSSPLALRARRNQASLHAQNLTPRPLRRGVHPDRHEAVSKQNFELPGLANLIKFNKFK